MFKHLFGGPVDALEIPAWRLELVREKLAQKIKEHVAQNDLEAEAEFTERVRQALVRLGVPVP